MNRCICFLLFAVAACNPLRVLAQDSDVIFRSDVSLVRVDAQVVDRDNRAITGLRVTDFVLREDGRPQEIRNFASENMPVDVLLLLDVSASMRPHVQRIADAAHQALRVLGAEDRVGIMVFDRSTRLRLPFRSGRGDVERELESLLNQETFNGGTDITRGLFDAASYVARAGRRGARRAIVILTDDQTEFNRDETGVSLALTRADAVLCALLAPDAMRGWPQSTGRIPQGGGSWPGGRPGVGGPLGGIILGRRRPPYGGGGPTMGGARTRSAGTAEIARRSGGDSMGVDDSYALESTLSRIRQRYALHFHLPEGVKPGQERAIEVTLADAARSRYPGAEVRYRRVYLAPSPDAGRSGAEPTVITRAPVDSRPSAEPAADRSPGVKRKPVAGDVSGSREGPLDIGGGSGAREARTTRSEAEDQGGWRRAPDDPAPSSKASDKPADTESGKGGWRRATPEELKNSGSDPAEKSKHFAQRF